MTAIIKDVDIGGQRLILGDCQQVMQELGGYDTLVSDPPYKIQTSGGGIHSKRTFLKEVEKAKIHKGFDYNIINSDLYGSAIVFCHNDQLVKLLPDLATKYKRYAMCAWQKTNPMPVANKHYQPELEIYVHAWNKGYHPQGDLSDKKRIFKHTVGKSDYDHPTVKPLGLMQKVVTNATGTILDPFMGTGTTLVACEKLGRLGVGIEINEKYFNIACERVDDAANQLEMF